jgi:tRNA modification GTPase
VDTAGIRTSGDRLEMLGVDRSVKEVKESDLILFVINMSEGFVEDDRAVWKALEGHPYLVVMNKTDLGGVESLPEEIARPSRGSIQVSARTGSKLGDLAERIRDFTGAPEASDRGRTLVTNLRQKECLDEAVSELEQAIQALEEGLSEEFVSYDVRRALKALEELMGETTTGEILDRIFSTFCIGK